MPHRVPATLVTHASARAFLDRAGPWLLQREAEHNLLLGIAHRLAEKERLPDDVLLATVEQDEAVVGCAFRTPPWKLGLTGMPTEAIEPVVDTVAGRYETLPAVLGPEAIAGAFAEAWRARTGTSVTPGMRQRIFQLTRLREPANRPPGGMRAATAADHRLVADWVEAFTADAGVPLHEDMIRERIQDGAFHFWDHDGPKALAGWSGRTPHGVRIGPVYTPPAWRGRGYATALTAELSSTMLREGCTFCFLYTDVGNPTSNRIYQKIGYEPVCEVMDFHFTHADDD